jgi:exodeoxyribonuclease X
MQKLVFFDTETTGNTEDSFLCQIAYKIGDETFKGLYKPEVKIPPEASAVHHITNKMVEGLSSFKESTDYDKVKEVLEDENNIVVAHNTPFDLMIIKKEGIEPKRFICTLRVARHLDSDEKMSGYRLQYLRYFLELEVDGEAHDALGDVLVCERLFENQKREIMEKEGVDEAGAVEKMLEISSHPAILRTIGFGKHRGKKVKEVLATDRGYLEWLLSEKLKSGEMDEDWIYTLKHYLGK